MDETKSKCEECQEIFAGGYKQKFCSNKCVQKKCRRNKKNNKLCVSCSAPAISKSYCDRCLVIHRERNKSCFNKNYRKRPRYLDQSKTLISSAKTRAKRKNIQFEITEDDIKPLPKVCPALGIKLERGVGKAHNNSLTIDRIDNSKGYTLNNISIISYRANFLKCDASLEELIKIVEYIASHRSGKKMECLLKEEINDNI